MLNNYDKIARYYDVLSRLLFHQSQVNAQIAQLKFIPPHSRILIAGGGTGWILEELSKVQDQGLHITYVEISAEMIRLAKKRNTGKNSIEFINCAIEEFPITASYDVVHTAFLFDNFAGERTATVFRILHQALKPGGLWLYTDFFYQPGTDQPGTVADNTDETIMSKHSQTEMNMPLIASSPLKNKQYTNEKWKGFLLKMMYGFFRRIANIEASSLPDTAIHFESGQYEKLDEKAYYRKFIKAIVYKKQAV